MKSLENYITEAKNPIQGGVKSGDEFWILFPGSNKPEQVKVIRVKEMPDGDGPDDVRIYLDKNKNSIVYFDAYIGDIEYADLDHAFAFYKKNDERGYKKIIFGKTKEDIQATLDGKYGDQLESLMKEIEEKQAELDKLNQNLEKLTKKAKLDLND